MINLEIIAANDPADIGNYPYEFDSVYIGSSKRADIQIIDYSIPHKFLTIKCIENQLIVQNENHSLYYFVNNKKMSGARKLKRGDVITIGTLQIKILDFKKTEPEENLEQFYHQLEKDSSELVFLLDIIEEKILEIEGKERNV